MCTVYSMTEMHALSLIKNSKEFASPYRAVWQFRQQGAEDIGESKQMVEFYLEGEERGKYLGGSFHFQLIFKTWFQATMM